MAPLDVPPKDEDPINDKPMPLLEHLVELRKRLMVIAIAVVIGMAIAWPLAGEPLLAAKDSAGLRFNQAEVYL